MKALAVDSANTKIYIAAKNDDKIVTSIFDIGMKQSETLLPAISYVLEQAKLTAEELDYTALCKGPGSFTGLRLGFAALKALELANGTHIYGVMSLDAYANAYMDFPQTIVSVIDAKKEKFYAVAYKNKNCILKAGDYEIETIIDYIKDSSKQDSKGIIVTGPDAKAFAEIAKEKVSGTEVLFTKTQIPSTDSLFEIAEQMIEKKEPPLSEYEGPEYMRASEAEENLTK